MLCRPATMLVAMRRVDVAAPVVAFFLGLIVHIAAIAGTPIGGTEGHRVITASQMLQQNQWLVPMLFDKPYGRKPPMQYWLIAASISLLGENTFAYRLPSVLAFALTCAAVAWASLLWFGPRAAWTSGIACAGLVALWAQSRSADIDAANTFASVAVALLILHMDLRGGPRWTIVVLTSVLCAASMLLKIPGNLPLIIGAWLAVMVQVDEGKCRWRVGPVLRLWRFFPLIIGLMAFAMWVVAAMAWIKARGFEPDLSGAAEGTSNIVRWLSEPQRVAGIALFPVLLMVFGLPASLGAFTPLRRDLLPLASPEKRVMIARVTTTLVVSVVLMMLAGQTNPRYGYPLLPVAAVGLGAAVELWCLQSPRPLARILTCGVAAILLGSIFFTHTVTKQRDQRSGQAAARLLIATLGPGASITTGWMLFAHPEILWYADAKVTSPGQRPIQASDFKPAGDIEPAGQFMLLHATEFISLTRDLPGQLALIQVLPTPSGAAYLVQMGTAPDKAPDTRTSRP